MNGTENGLRLTAALALLLGVSAASAGSIYKCTQADGGVAFQETPCASHARQTEVGSIARAGNGSAASADAATADAPARKTGTASSGKDECVVAGESVFAGIGRSHPHAAMLACQRELKGRDVDSECLERCLNTWVEHYKNAPEPDR